MDESKRFANRIDKDDFEEIKKGQAEIKNLILIEKERNDELTQKLNQTNKLLEQLINEVHKLRKK